MPVGSAWPNGLGSVGHGQPRPSESRSTERLLPGRSTEDLWDKDIRDQARADQPKGSCMAERLRICGTRITETKQEPIRGWPFSFPKPAKFMAMG